MLLKKITLIGFIILSFFSFGQDNASYNGSLVEYLTEVNLNIETKMVNNYCNCSDKSQLVNKYQDVAKEFNSLLNKYITELTLLRSKKAIEQFKIVNSNSTVISQDITKAYTVLDAFLKIPDCAGQRGFLPTTISVSEITGVVNAILGVISSNKEKKDKQKAELIQILQSLRIPSIQSYECK
ncbi:MAG: hypothetical protein AAFX55_12445 [Bacteroidota bacterium]